MHLESNALDFYDRNCIGCDKRVPVSFPNLSELVGERERSLEVAAGEMRERERREIALLDRRDAERAGVFVDPTHAQRSLLNLLNRLDREPSEESEREFLAATKAVGDETTGPFWQAVIEVMNAGGDHRVRAALLALEASSSAPSGMGDFALRALARGDALETAADVALRHMAGCSREAIREAAPALLGLTREPFDLRFEDPLVSRPETIVAAHQREPDVIQDAIVRSLASKDKIWRRIGCFAVGALLEHNCEFDVATVAQALVSSFRLPDDPYLHGPTSDRVAVVLAELFRRFDGPVEALLLQHEEDGDERVRSGVFQAYAEVFRFRDRVSGRVARRDETRERGPSDAESRSFDRILATVSRLVDDELLALGAEFLGQLEFRDWVARASHAPVVASVLLGVAAMAAKKAETARRSSSVILDPRPEPIRQIEVMGMTSGLSRLAAECLKIVIHISRHHTVAKIRQEVRSLILETLRSLPDHEYRFKAKVIEQLGSLFGDPDLRAQVLPEIYSAMTDSSAVVRASASEAYADACRQVSPEALPPLLHESFLVHFRDPYGVVHKTAVRCLARSVLPTAYRPRVLRLVWAVVQGYIHAPQEHRDEMFVVEGLQCILMLSPGEGRAGEAVRNAVVEAARSLSVDSLSFFLHRCWRWLLATPGFGALVLALPFRSGAFDNQNVFLLKLLEDLPGEEIARAAPRLIERGVATARRRPLAALPLVTILDRHGLTQAANNLAAAAVEAGGLDQARLPERLRMAVYAQALAIEIALEEGRFEAVDVLAAQIRELETKIAEDDQVNSERRNRHVFS